MTLLGYEKRTIKNSLLCESVEIIPSLQFLLASHVLQSPFASVCHTIALEFCDRTWKTKAIFSTDEFWRSSWTNVGGLFRLMETI